MEKASRRCIWSHSAFGSIMAQVEEVNSFQSWSSDKQQKLMDQVGHYMRQQDENYDVAAFTVRVHTFTTFDPLHGARMPAS
jgi:hypothetical protein